MPGHRPSRRLFLQTAALLGAPVHAATEATLADRMPDFWRAYDAMRGHPMAERAEHLAQGYFTAERALYQRAGMRPVSAARAAAWLVQFDPLADAVRTLHARLAAEFRQHLRRFQARFDDFDAAASPVFVLPSLWSFDAHLEPDGRTLPLFFGPDGIVRYHGADADLGVLLAHEIFHCYQGQRNPSLSLDPKPPVYVGLWIEGTATWASEQLHPEASLRHVLLDDEALLRLGPATAPRVASALLQRLDSTDDADLNAFFGMGWKGDWPARAGYYVGLLAARRLGRTASMQEMAGWPGAVVQEQLARVLEEIRTTGTR